MAEYLLVYRGGSMPETDEAKAAVMDAWTAWFGQLGGALKDGGNPFTPVSKTISADGSISDTTATPPATGYSIISADSLDAAVDLAKGCPVLEGGASVDVHETFPVM